jgi:hypothetical protein
MDGGLQGSPSSDLSQQGFVPTSFTALTFAAVMAAAHLARMARHDPARAACKTAWGLHPSLPESLIGNAVEHVPARARWGAPLTANRLLADELSLACELQALQELLTARCGRGSSGIGSTSGCASATCSRGSVACGATWAEDGSGRVRDCSSG